MTRYIEHIVNAAGDREITRVRVANRAISGEIQGASQFIRVVAFAKALRVAPDGADHRRPGLSDDQHAALPIRDLVAGFIDDSGIYTGQRQRAGTGNERGNARQRRDHVTARFRLPERVEHGTSATANMLRVPVPGARVDGFTDRAEDAQRAQVVTRGMHRAIRFSALDERPDGSRRGVESRHLVALDHVPEAAGVRVRGHTFENDLGRANGGRPVADVRMPRDPADVGGTPEDIVRLDVEGPLHGDRSPQQIASRTVLHTLRRAGGP
ncbi:hypothetical protein BSU04_10245 [Caballeronia sordidicola]|uniref:Uncharacterized protein n=1 Tax=Caballeronia sordidicola TaxID=196367 RepID=A0A226X5S2_CABSO|nr:hypothetical protein BSU04_10245 [Caballeronia sordidicola]